MLLLGDMGGLSSAPIHSVTDGGQSSPNEPQTYPQGLQMCDRSFTQHRPCVAKSHIYAR
jgi:hypothetical protein